MVSWSHGWFLPWMFHAMFYSWVSKSVAWVNEWVTDRPFCASASFRDTAWVHKRPWDKLPVFYFSTFNARVKMRRSESVWSETQCSTPNSDRRLFAKNSRAQVSLTVFVSSTELLGSRILISSMTKLLRDRSFVHHSERMSWFGSWATPEAMDLHHVEPWNPDDWLTKDGLIGRSHVFF